MAMELRYQESQLALADVAQRPPGLGRFVLITAEGEEEWLKSAYEYAPLKFGTLRLDHAHTHSNTGPVFYMGDLEFRPSRLVQCDVEALS